MHIAVVLRLGLLAFIYFVVAFRADAQASPTASKTMDVAVFAGYTFASADVYTRTRPSGFAFGADITRYIKGPVVPSLEARVNLVSSPTASERTYLFGFRAEPRPLLKLPRFHPYGDILAGRGTVHFADPVAGYLGDNSVVFSYGGGFEFDIAHNVSFKADYQRQHWNTGEVTTKPNVLTFGVQYRFPMKPSWKQKVDSR